MISVDGLAVEFGGTTLFSDISFVINEKDRIALMGKNGAGKSTLLKILAGVRQPTRGKVSAPKDCVVAYLPQHLMTEDGRTVFDETAQAFAHLHEMEAQIDRLNKELETRTDYESDSYMALIEEVSALSEKFYSIDATNYEEDVEKSLLGLGFTREDFQRQTSDFSGGWRMRIELAKLLLQKPDVLLLDEPTNHLDLRATEWLEAYLLHFRGTVLVISHDRYFLDRVVQRSIDFTSGEAEFYSGNYSFYVVERQRRFDEQLKKYEKDQAKLQQLTEAAAKLHLWAFMGNDKLHKRAFSIEKRMEKLETTARPTEARKLNVHFTAQEFRGDDVLTMTGLGKRYGARTLFHDLDLTVTGGERIALIGDNGAGKTTFLRLVMNEETPDTGWVQRGPAVRTAYLPQIVRFAVPERSMLDTMLYECKCTPQEARDQLAAYGFCGEDVLKPVSALSGGELSRLRLCMLMRREINFLILDEPTNHLDIASREWIEDALSDYTQALLFVSHDRYFIEKFASRIWLLENGTITDYRGTYEQFREYRARQTALQQTAKAVERKKEPKPKPKRAPNTTRQRERTEREIEKLEGQLAALDAESEANATDYQKLMELDAQKQALNAQLEALYEAWEALCE